jgi:hypothetical protein
MILLAALALPLAAVAVTRVHLGSPAGLPAGLRGELTDEVRSILETSSVVAHLGDSHDHDSAAPARVLCAVEVFGVDPATARDRVDVSRVFAQHLCAIAPPGTPWEFASKSAGPVAVILTEPPGVVLPQPRRDYRTQVREMIPARYLTQAFGTFTHPDVVARLRDRFTAEVTAARPATPSP